MSETVTCWRCLRCNLSRRWRREVEDVRREIWQKQTELQKWFMFQGCQSPLEPRLLHTYSYLFISPIHQFSKTNNEWEESTKLIETWKDWKRIKNDELQNMKNHKNQNVSFWFVGCLHLCLNDSDLYTLHILLDSLLYLCKSRPKLKKAPQKHARLEWQWPMESKQLSNRKKGSNQKITMLTLRRNIDIMKDLLHSFRRQPGLPQPAALQGLPSLTHNSNKSAFRRNLSFHFHLNSCDFT